MGICSGIGGKMTNKILWEKDLDELNKLIIEYNKHGWYVKQIFVYGDGSMLTKASGIFALMEHPQTIR